MTHNRRGFLQFSSMAGAASAFGQTRTRRFLIDGHQHYGEAPGYIKTLVDFYAPRNAMACVLTFIKDWEVVKRGARDHPDVVIPYGRIIVDDPEALHHVDKFASEGAKGIKMHKPRDNWDDARYFPIYDRIDRYKMVALFHTGIAFHVDTPEYSSMARMRPEYLDTIARAFPNLYIHGAHFGNPWYAEAAEVARWSPRVYFDMTGSTLIKKAKNPGVFREYLWWEGPGLHSSPHAVPAFEKLVFGTDEEPDHLDAVVARYEAMFDACQVPESSRKKVYGETLAKILGVKART